MYNLIPGVLRKPINNKIVASGLLTISYDNSEIIVKSDSVSNILFRGEKNIGKKDFWYEKFNSVEIELDSRVVQAFLHYS